MAMTGERKLKLVENPPVVEIRDVTKDLDRKSVV